MRFRWKIFYIFTSLIALVFGVFGAWIVNAAFQASLEREIERGNLENQMFQLTFEMAMDSMNEEYKLVQDRVVRDIAGTMKKSMGNNSYIRIYGKQAKILFNDARIKGDEQLIDKLGDSDSGYEILQENGGYYLTVMSKSEIEENTFYLENIIEISYIYQEREQLFQQYRIAMLGVLVGTGLMTLLLSRFLTRSVVVLSKVTRKFSKGDYQIRAKRISDDEIGELTQDFNTMADNLSQKIEMLSQEARRQEDFTASFAHEIKTPLTSIIGYAEMLRTMNLSQEEIMEASNYIYSQGKRLESLSFKLMDIIVAEKQCHPFSQISVCSLFEEIEKIVMSGLEKKGIQLNITLEDGILTGDKDLLISLFVNLVDNARKSMDYGGQVEITGNPEPVGYRIMVKDNGCGIPEKEVEKITEAFYMVDKSRARKEGGAGLGMTLCSRIVSIHRAKWYIQSKEGEGTAIWVTIPGQEAVYE